MKRIIWVAVFSLWLVQLFAQQTDSVHVFLDSVLVKLPEVMVKGERPIVKVEDGKLKYDVPRLIKDKAVNNAFDAIKELPGVISRNENDLSLIGSSSLHIIINGQLSTMSYEQLLSLLKSIPASMVAKAEVMYSAPPQYNVRGALINILLEEQMEDTLQGEVAAAYSQTRYGSTMLRGNLLYATSRFSLDALYSNNWTQWRTGEDLLSLHTYNDVLNRITQVDRGKGKQLAHNVRIGTGYTFKSKDKLNLTYTAQLDDATSRRHSETDFALRDEVAYEKVYTDNSVKGPSGLHNLRLEYNSHFGLVAGADYTYYKDKSDQDLANRSGEELKKTILSASEQRIHKGMVYVNQTHTLPDDWGLTYGVNVSFSRNNSFSDTWQDDNFDEASSFRSIQNERTVNAFAGFTKTFAQKLSVQASIAAEYYKTTEESGGRTSTLWDNVAWFPNVNISYVISPTHILQLSLSSDKKYPSYWEINPVTNYLNAYSVMKGNPYLKPSRSYEFQCSYIFKQKYVLTAFVNHTSDYFVQLQWQSDESLNGIFQPVNFDFSRIMGAALVVPFKIGEILNSQLTLQSFQKRERASDFHQLSFDRKRFFGFAMLSNTVKLSSSPDLKLDISGYYATSSIQGIYDLSDSYQVSAGLKWTFAKEKAQLMLRCDDIFNSTIPETTVNYAGQHSRMNVLSDRRTVSLSFVYKFGGFKESKKSDVDTSRFGR